MGTADNLVECRWKWTGLYTRKNMGGKEQVSMWCREESGDWKVGEAGITAGAGGSGRA